MGLKMLTSLIIARTARLAVLGLLVAVCLGGTIGCESSPLLAPSGSTITLTSSTNALPVNATTDIIAQVLESSGTPPHSGTLVSFTTTLGSIQPNNAPTDSSGRVIVRFYAGSANGTATINAYSGGSTTSGSTSTGGTGGTTTPTTGAVKISVGTAAVGRVVINANPAQVPNTGGTTTITATVFDINGNGLSGAPVSFTTTSGTLGSSLVSANVDGVAATTLTTNLAATVTASVGATAATPPATGGGTTPAPSGSTSASTTISITAAPTIAITPPATAPSVGLPATFTFVVTVPATNGSAVRDVRVNWGDGDSVSLGAVTGSQAATHVYNREGSFTVTATVTDVNGVTNSSSTVVTLIPVASPTIIITPSVPSTGGATVTRVTFTIQVTPPSGVIVTTASIFFGDGQFQSLGGLTGTATILHDYDLAHRGANTVTVNVTDSLGRTTTGQTTISVP